MKKILVVLFLLLTTLSLFSCDKDAEGNKDSDNLESLSKFDIVEVKDIVLGNEVNSVVLINNEGKEITFDSTADFYEIFNEIGFSYNESGKKYSYSAEMKIGDQSKSFINMNAYYFGDSELYEFRTKKDGDDAVAACDEYSYRKYLENNKLESSDFGIYAYKDDKAFGGSESGENGYVVYASDTYPIIPNVGTELIEMQARSVNLRSIVNMTRFFNDYRNNEADDVEYNYNELVTREYKLYENYIVFKQTAPFWDLPIIGSGQDESIVYARFADSDFSVTQEAYYNIKTGEIELVKVYGETLCHAGGYYLKNLEINIQIFVNDLEESEGKAKVDAMIAYIKENAD